MIENNHQIQRKARNSKFAVSNHISFFNTMYSFYYDFYDDREEVEKDIWDFEKLGIEYNEDATKRSIDFTGIKEPWKPFVKRYIHERCVVVRDIKNPSGVLAVIRLTYLFNWLTKSYPEWTDLKELGRKDILDFVNHLRTSPMGGTRYSKPATDLHVKKTILCLSVFLEYIHFHEWDMAPTIDCRRLITSAEKPESYKKRSEPKGNKVDYIPDEVWKQLVYHIDKLSPVYKIMALTLEESEFRISDICSLKLGMDHGISVKSPKLPCSFIEDVIEPPCIKNSCRSFHVDNTFLDFYQSEINKMTDDIELFMKKGRIRSAELTERRLASYRKILNEINENSGVFGLPKHRSRT